MGWFKLRLEYVGNALPHVIFMNLRDCMPLNIAWVEERGEAQIHFVMLLRQLNFAL